MKILLITGSPHKTGTTAQLADRFIAGAEAAGHEVVRFDAAFHEVHPCIACEHCHKTDKGCVFSDDMSALNPDLLSADAVVLVSPIYYYDWNAQLKTVIDRFYANSAALREHPKKCALILGMGDTTMASADGAIMSYRGMTGYLGWKDMGIIAALGCQGPEDLKNTAYPDAAYELGQWI